MPEKNHLEDDVNDPVGHLLGHRLPWLALGLLGGMVTSIIVSKYEAILSADIRLAFFVPVIVYLSDAVGTQTETIYVRHIKKTGTGFGKYLFKETILGLCLGSIFGLAIGLFAQLWLHSTEVGLTVGLAMLINVAIAPVLATIVPALLYKEHSDPALGAGPLATIIQDLISLLIYFFIASLIIF
ncbi:MAG: magnesium transporter [bacterium]|nr:magnesium transporter [bacterium]